MQEPNVERLVDTFIRLARIDSPSRHEGAIAAMVANELRALSWQVWDDGSGPETGNLVARLEGAAATEPLLFSAHFDVVPPCLGVQPRVRNGWIESDGTTVLGADAKAGLAALLELARLLPATPPARRGTVELLLTWGEELGHLGAKAFDPTLVASRRAFVLDALLPVGSIVVAAPGYDAFSIAIRGRAAHAGLEPESGISAIAVVAEAISRLPWGRLDPESTANIGTIVGGTARNAVPEQAQVEGEVRSFDPARLAAYGRAIAEAFQSAASAAGARAEVVLRPVYVPYRLADDSVVVDLARRAFIALGGQPCLTRTGSGSDANELNPMGIEACVLGIGAEACHSVRERIAIAELARLTSWVLRIIEVAAAVS